MPREVLIVGGGLAGLAAGVSLSSAGHQVHLLEQKPHLGGRARSFRDPSIGSVVDNGQHILMGCYRSALEFFETIGTTDRVRFQPALAVSFLDLSGKLTRLECPNLPAPWHLLAGVFLSSSFTRSQKFEVLRLGRALESARLRENNGGDGDYGLSVEDWLRRNGQSESLQRNFWNLLCIAAMNEDPRIASAALFEHVLRLALFRSPQDSRLGIPRVGLSDCYTQAAKDYIEARGGRIELGQNVSGLLVSAGVCEGVKLAEGGKLQAQTVLSAVPWFEFARLVPGELLHSEPFFTDILALRPAPIISIDLWFDQPVTDLDFVGLRGTTIQWLFNKGKIFGTNENYVSLVLSGAHEHIAKPKEELLAVARAELGALLPPTRGAKLVHSLVLKERFATFSPDCDVESVRPRAKTPVEGLYLAGDWTATGLPATIEGAVKSGYTAAQEILQSD